MEGRVLRTREDAEYYFEEGCHILELSNNPADPEASIARARVPQGGQTRWHRLLDTTERYVIVEGHAEVSVGERVEQVEAGDVVIIPAAVPQRIRNLGSADLIFLAICTPRFQPNCYEDLPLRESGDP